MYILAHAFMLQLHFIAFQLNFEYDTQSFSSDARDALPPGVGL